MPGKLLSAIPRMKILSRPTPSAVAWSTGVERTASAILEVGPVMASACETTLVIEAGKRSSGTCCLLAVTITSGASPGTGDDGTTGAARRGAIRTMR